MDSGLQQEILSILKAAGEMTVATVRPDGYPQATMVNYVSDGFVIYFGCAAESQKVRNIACNDKVSLTVTPTHFDWEDIRGLSIGQGGAGDRSAGDQSRERAHVAEVPTNLAIRVSRQERRLSGPDHPRGHLGPRFPQRVWPYRSSKNLRGTVDEYKRLQRQADG